MNTATPHSTKQLFFRRVKYFWLLQQHGKFMLNPKLFESKMAEHVKSPLPNDSSERLMETPLKVMSEEERNSCKTTDTPIQNGFK